MLKRAKSGRNRQVWNEGLLGLASGQEVSAYFYAVMNETFLPSNRVRYYPLCEYKGNKQFISTLSGKQYNVTVYKKIVDATYLNTNIPLTHNPSFTRDDDVAFTPVNTVVQNIEGFENYVVVGGGKTGIDTCLWLLEKHVAPR